MGWRGGGGGISVCRCKPCIHCTPSNDFISHQNAMSTPDQLGLCPKMKKKKKKKKRKKGRKKERKKRKIKNPARKKRKSPLGF